MVDAGGKTATMRRMILPQKDITSLTGPNGNVERRAGHGTAGQPTPDGHGEWLFRRFWA
jgi:hypothetical protein